MLIFSISSTAVMAEPDRITLNDGRILENVTAAEFEDDKVKISHSGGTGRVAINLIAPASLVELGLPAEKLAVVSPPVLQRVETLDGKIYEGIRSVRVKPSFISFVHRDGSTSVRLENLNASIQKECGYDKAVADIFDAERTAAETAMAKAEQETADSAARIAYSKEQRRRRSMALYNLQFTNYGSNSYWLTTPQHRGLIDAMMARSLSEAGFSAGEAARHLNNAKFR